MGLSGSSSAVNGQNHAMKFDEDEKNDPLGIEDILCFFFRRFLKTIILQRKISQKV